MNEHVGCTGCGAMSTFVTCIGNADLAQCETVSDAKKSAVRTRVCAKSFLPEKIHGHKPADK